MDTKWSDWQTWSQCSNSCGSGTRRRLRVCEYSASGKIGRTCTGSELEYGTCFITHCPGKLIFLFTSSVYFYRASIYIFLRSVSVLKTKVWWTGCVMVIEVYTGWDKKIGATIFDCRFPPLPLLSCCSLFPSSSCTFRLFHFPLSSLPLPFYSHLFSFRVILLTFSSIPLPLASFFFFPFALFYSHIPSVLIAFTFSHFVFLLFFLEGSTMSSRPSRPMICCRFRNRQCSGVLVVW